MEIKIDLDTLLGSRDTLRDEIIEAFRTDLDDSIKREVEKIISSELKNMIKEKVGDRVQCIIADSLDDKFYPTDEWGKKRKETTIREQIIEEFKKQSTYKKSNWDSDKNAFTKIFDQLLSDHLQGFKKEFLSQFNSTLVNEAMEYALNTIRARLKINK